MPFNRCQREAKLIAKAAKAGGIAISLLVVAGCATESETINLTLYAPVIDIKGQGYDASIYYQDLDECRMLGMRVQATYKAQRKKRLKTLRKMPLSGRWQALLLVKLLAAIMIITQGERPLLALSMVGPLALHMVRIKSTIAALLQNLDQQQWLIAA